MFSQCPTVGTYGIQKYELPKYIQLNDMNNKLPLAMYYIVNTVATFKFCTTDIM